MAATLQNDTAGNIAVARTEPIIPPSLIESTADRRRAQPVPRDVKAPADPADRPVVRVVLPFVVLIVMLVLLVVLRAPYVSTPLGYVIVAGIATVATVVWTFRVAHFPRH